MTESMQLLIYIFALDSSWPSFAVRTTPGFSWLLTFVSELSSNFRITALLHNECVQIFNREESVCGSIPSGKTLVCNAVMAVVPSIPIEAQKRYTVMLFSIPYMN